MGHENHPTRRRTAVNMWYFSPSRRTGTNREPGPSNMQTNQIIQRFLLLAALGTVVASAQQITVYSGGNLAIGETKQLTAYVPLAINTVTWSVNGVLGGNSTYGTVSQTGLYAAPTVVPMANAVSVRATSTADATKFGQITITVTQPVPQLWSVSPTSVPAGPFTITLNGAAYAANAVVNLGGVPIATTLLSPTGLRATG